MSAAFHVLIFLEAKAGKADVLARILNDLVEPSRAEDGCRYYEPFADIENPNKFTVIEAWDSATSGKHIFRRCTYRRRSEKCNLTIY